MQIALIGATGRIGSRLLQEALRRGHGVTAIARHAGQLLPRAGLWPLELDVFDTAALSEAVRGAEAILYAYKAPNELTIAERIDAQARAIGSTLAAARAAGAIRILGVGGAGTLEVAPGRLNMDSAEFPKAWEGGAKSTAMVTKALQAQHDVPWTVLSPSHHLIDGERTGKFRLGEDRMLIGADGQSRISTADYAMALIDELENPRHTGRRFTVGY